jgi:methionine-rich copper-binding protein CopC
MRERNPPLERPLHASSICFHCRCRARDLRRCGLRAFQARVGIACANATVAKLARVQLRVSEKLVPAFSKADLMMEAKGMAAMKQLSTSALAADGRTLVITPQGPLDPGRYTVSWHVVSTDTHKIAGSYVFAVK